MATPDPSNKEDVARWASGITLGLSGPMKDDFDAKPYFATADHRIFYASVFNQTTAYSIHKLTAFHWKCCLEANELKDAATGAKMVAVVESHLLDKNEEDVPTGTKLWFAKGGGP